MSSGSFEIESYSWQTSLPVQPCGGGYDTGTMFAVGPCATLYPYTFYQYQSSIGSMDTSTLSNILSTNIYGQMTSNDTRLQNTISSVYHATKTYVSTVPLVRWVSASVIQSSPFTFESTFPVCFSTIQTTFTSNVVNTFVSTGIFGYYDSNIYPGCTGYSYISTFPITTSNIAFTTEVTFPSTVISTLLDAVSSVYATAEIINFESTVTLGGSNSRVLQFSNVWLGEGLQTLIDSKQYNVFVECQYDIYVCGNQDRYMYISSVGTFGYPGTELGSNGYEGRTTVNRVPDQSYAHMYTKQMFVPQPSSFETQLAPANSNYAMNVVFSPASSSGCSSGPGGCVYADVFAPGENNFTFTLVPISNLIFS
jgi:hypothetical protein